MKQYTLISTGLTNGFGELIPSMIKDKDLFHILLARTPENVSGIDKSNVKIIKCDLASIKSVLEAVKQIKELVETGKAPPVKYFLGNGAIQFPDRVHKTVDGFETTFHTNVISYYFLLHKGIIDLMEKVPHSRVFLTGSGVHYGANRAPGMPNPVWPKDLNKAMLPIKDDSGDDPNSGVAGRRAYVLSKLALIYLAHKLADLHPNIDFLVYDPAVVPGTQLGRNAPFVFQIIILIVRYCPLFYLLPAVSTTKTAATRVVNSLFAEKMVDSGNVSYSSRGTFERSSDLSYNNENKESLWKALQDISV